MQYIFHPTKNSEFILALKNTAWEILFTHGRFFFLAKKY